MPESKIFLDYLLPAITFGFAAGVQPGPLTVYLITRTLQNGWKKTFPAIFAPIISDIPVALVCLLILGSLPPSFLKYIQILGGLFILYLAFRAAQSWRKNKETDPVRDISSGRTLFDAITVNILNPNAYLGWSLVIGPLFLRGWKVAPVIGISLLAGFYLTMFTLTTIIIILFSQARGRGPKLQRILLGLSAIILALFGLYQLLNGILN